jgi:cation transport ATPase
MKMKVAMCTGDNQYSALMVANYLGIESDLVTARAYPNDKKRLV